MHVHSVDQVQPAVLSIQGMLQKIDRLYLPPASRRDLESILVRQVTRELDRLLPWQAGHGEATAVIAVRAGQAVGLHNNLLHQLKLAALLHDIGLLMLPTQMQTGRESHDPDSYTTIQNHPRLGSILLEPFPFLREAAVIIAHHHERWDGSGYPYGLRGEFIPLGARILAVADAFAAIQVPHSHDRLRRDRIALRILRIAAGTQLDPLVVDTLVELLLRNDSIAYERTAPPIAQPAYHLRRLQSGRSHPSHFTRQGSSPPEDPCRPYMRRGRT